MLFFGKTLDVHFHFVTVMHKAPLLVSSLGKLGSLAFALHSFMDQLAECFLLINECDIFLNFLL